MLHIPWNTDTLHHEKFVNLQCKNKCMMKRLIISVITMVTMSVCGIAQHTNGYFIVCEGQYGVEPGLLNFYSTKTGELSTNLLNNGSGESLGMTAQFATLSDGRLFITSKQNFGSGGRVVVLDAATLEVLASHAEVDGDADTRGIAVVPEVGKFYVGTNRGLYVYDLDTMEQLGQVEGTGADDATMYGAGMGDMAVRNGKLYVACPAGVMVVDTESDVLTSTIAIENTTTVFSVHGQLYAAVNSATWGTPKSTDSERFVPITDDDTAGEPHEVPAASVNCWFTPKPCAPAELKGANAVVYCSGEGLNYLSKYDFDTRQYTERFIEFTGKQQMYGHCIATDPESGDVLVCTFQSYGSTNYWFSIYDGSTGELKTTVKMPGHYWFPSQIVRSLWEATETQGDVNDDKATDVSDVVAIANHVMGDTPEVFITAHADMNSDHDIDVSDVVTLANRVMGD